MNERRRLNRSYVSLEARCRTRQGGYQPIRIADLHHKGCGIESEGVFQNGQELSLNVYLPPEGYAYMTAFVVWQKPLDSGRFRYGLKFVLDNPLAEGFQLRLYDYCRAHGSL